VGAIPSPAMAFPLLAGVEMGGTKCVCTLGTGPADIRAQQVFPTRDPDSTLAAMASALQGWQREHGAFAALGVAAFGPLDLRRGSASYGRIQATPKELWRGVDLLGFFRSRFDVPIGLSTDVMGAAFLGKLRVIGRGAEQRFALAEPPLANGSGLTELLRAYLRGYGPATKKDFSYWTGLPLRDLAAAFAELGDELVETPAGYVLSELSHEAPRPPRALLLAKFDPLTMGHADKSRWLDPKDQGRVFRKAAQVEAVVLLKGRAAATWRVTRGAKSAVVAVETFRTLRPPERAALERAAHKLGASIGWGSVEVAME